MTPNPDCPDCRGAGEILMLHGMVPCACTERDEGRDPGLNVTCALEDVLPKFEAWVVKWDKGKRKVVCETMAPVVIPPVPQVFAADPPPKGLESITVNGNRLMPGETCWFNVRGTKLAVQFIPPNRLLIDLRD